MADGFIFLQKKDFLSPLIPILFEESRQKKINNLFEKEVFELVSISEVQKNMRI